jgi:hypothetical protein
MDLPGPTTSVGTRTDYSVGPWDYTACATRHLMAWSTRTTKEKYSVRKLYPINPELRSIQDVGYYAPRGPNLSKLCATCLFLRFTDLGEATFIYFGYSP